MLNVGKYFHTWSHLIVWVYDQTNPRLPNTLGLEVLGPPKPTQKAKLQQVFGRLAKQMFHQNSLVVYQIYYIDFQPRTLGKMIPLDYYITYIYIWYVSNVWWKTTKPEIFVFSRLSGLVPQPLDTMALTLKLYASRTVTNEHDERSSSRWWQLKYVFNFHPYLGKISNLTYIFQMGWNH